MDSTKVVVETNILFAALLHRESPLRETILTDSGHTFFSSHFAVGEIFKHKERLQTA